MTDVCHPKGWMPQALPYRPGKIAKQGIVEGLSQGIEMPQRYCARYLKHSENPWAQAHCLIT
jgi:hypothetical protein